MRLTTAPTQVSPRPPAGRTGFTLVELLVVVFIIGMLVALLLPAVQSARESGRNIECKNHLHQISLALLLHADAHGSFPSSGWGWKWPPNPSLGDEDRQPGSWVYSILPHLGTKRPAIIRPAERIAAGRGAADVLLPQPRAAELYPCANTTVYSPVLPLVAKSDYATNTGDHDDPNAAGPSHPFVQPATLSDGDSDAWWQAQGVVRDATGVVFQRSSIRPAEIIDGLTQTYLVGEKYLNVDDYTTGAGLGDMESVYHGDNDDTSRVTFPPDGGPRQDGRNAQPQPLR